MSLPDPDLDKAVQSLVAYQKWLVGTSGGRVESHFEGGLILTKCDLPGPHRSYAIPTRRLTPAETAMLPRRLSGFYGADPLVGRMISAYQVFDGVERRDRQIPMVAPGSSDNVTLAAVRETLTGLRISEATTVSELDAAGWVRHLADGGDPQAWKPLGNTSGNVPHADASKRVFLAYDGGTGVLVATASVFTDADPLVSPMIKDVAVVPDQQRRGIGRAVTFYAAGEAGPHLPKPVLFATEQSEPVYASIGFRTVGDAAVLAVGVSRQLGGQEAPRSNLA